MQFSWNTILLCLFVLSTKIYWTLTKHQTHFCLTIERKTEKTQIGLKTPQSTREDRLINNYLYHCMANAVRDLMTKCNCKHKDSWWLHRTGCIEHAWDEIFLTEQSMERTFSFTQWKWLSGSHGDLGKGALRREAQ